MIFCYFCRLKIANLNNKSKILLLGVLLATLVLFIQSTSVEPASVKHYMKFEKVNTTDSIYNSIFPNNELNIQAFRQAFFGMKQLLSDNKLSNDSLLTIVDFSKKCNEKRLFLVDIKNRCIIKNTLVAHGMNTGVLEATSFSNQVSSHKSSLGLYLTGSTYTGKHGYSLRLIGLEKGINNNALKRAIVVHAAKYVSNKYIQKNGRIGRSFGCPALPLAENKVIIDLIKDNSCFYIYHPSYQETKLMPSLEIALR